MMSFHLLPAITAIALAIAPLNSARAVEVMVGHASVIDGDTIEIKGFTASMRRKAGEAVRMATEAPIRRGDRRR